MEWRDNLRDRLVASPCSNPELELDEALEAYSQLGYRKFEAFTSWVKSALDVEADPAAYIELAAKYGMSFTSVHLPPVGDNQDETLERALGAARFAKAIGAGVVLFKATSRRNYVVGAGPFLDGIRDTGLTPVLQNHAGSPITTLEDFAEVIEGIADGRMKALLEVGHFHTAGVSWREACDLLGETIALVHVKDQVGGRSVPFGTGEIDLEGLFVHMAQAGYRGDYVVEMEVEDRENTLEYLAGAIDWIETFCGGRLK